MHYIANESAVEAHLRASPDFAALPAPVTAVAVLYAKRMLDEQMKGLQYTANYTSIQEMRGKIMLRLLATGYISAVGSAMPYAIVETYGRQRITDRLFDAISASVMQAIRVAPKFKGDADWLAEYNLARDELHAALGHDDEVIAKLEEGSLALGDVFERIPSYFITAPVLRLR